MKLTSVLLASLACATSASADYFSDGWKPGQAAHPTREAASAPPTYTPGSEPPQSQQNKPAAGGFSNFIASGPIGSLLEKVGVNLSHDPMADLWDHRVPLITDDNYDDIIVHEELTSEEEEKRLWFLIMFVPVVALLFYTGLTGVIVLRQLERSNREESQSS